MLVGSLAILIASTTSIGYFLARKRYNLTIAGWHPLAIGLAVHAATALLLLISLPQNIAVDLVKDLSVGIIVVNGIACGVLGYLLIISVRAEASGVKLRAVQSQLSKVMKQSPGVLYELRMIDNKITLGWVSPNIEDFIGYSVEEVMETGWWIDNIHPDDIPFAVEKNKSILAGRHSVSEYRVKRKDGSYIWVHDDARILSDSSSGDIEVIGNWIDNTASRKADERLRINSAAIGSMRDGVIITALDGTILTVNPAFTQITGYTEEEVIGKTPKILNSGRQDDAFYSEMWSRILEVGEWRGEIWNRRKNGEVYPEFLSISAVTDAFGRKIHYVAVFTDHTEIRKSQDKLFYLAQYDPLTDLNNRSFLIERLNRALDRSRRYKKQLGVLFIDLDNFKTVNDSLGHSHGDEVLLETAKRLVERTRSTDTLARIGGDEFVLIVEDFEDPQNIADLAHGLIASLSERFILANGLEAAISASIGICVAPDDGETSEELLRNADAAMYRAKENGRGQFQFYEASMSADAFFRLDTVAKLSKAIEKDEFILHYQPKVELSSEKIVGAEALIRWNHPERGLVTPGQFIPEAERTGQILAIGNWVIDETCRQIGEWQKQCFNLPVVAINVSARQFRSGDVVKKLSDAIARNNLPSNCIEVELTESILMDDPGEAVRLMQDLKELGVRLSLDDFGTGYSSMTYLHRFPIDTMKIDASFIWRISDDPVAGSIISSMITLGHDIGFRVIAEGVETQEQLDFLKQETCDIVQGYLFGKPMPADEFRSCCLNP